MGAAILGIVCVLASVGCNHLPGKPGFQPETLRPDQTLGFAVLYKTNCSACHGEGGMNGAAPTLNNPVYLAWAGRDHLLQIVSNGVPHQLMPAFAKSSGGMLTDQQVENIVDGMMAHWGKPSILNGANPPGYTATAKGDAVAGKAVFAVECSECHGADGKGDPTGPVKGSIVDPTFLSLISSQALRSVVVAGLPDVGMPDWRNHDNEKPMSDKDVTDVVAWLTSQLPQLAGPPDVSPERPPVGTNQPQRNPRRNP